jgi:hypothetical protein
MSLPSYLRRLEVLENAVKLVFSKSDIPIPALQVAGKTAITNFKNGLRLVEAIPQHDRAKGSASKPGLMFHVEHFF